MKMKEKENDQYLYFESTLKRTSWTKRGRLWKNELVISQAEAPPICVHQLAGPFLANSSMCLFANSWA